MQHGLDQADVFFRDEIVRARLDLEQRGLDRQFGSIVGMQVIFAAGRSRLGRVERKTWRECEAPQACGRQRCRNSLAAANEEVTPITASEKRIRQLPWLCCLTQSAASPGIYG